MNKIHIFFASDENFVQHLAVTITSILCNSNNDDEFIFYIMDGGISAKSKQKLNNLKKIKQFDIEFLLINKEEFKKCSIDKRCDYISIETYYRFKIASLKPELEKAIYLDSDIVVKKSLKFLWETDLKNFTLGAVEDVNIRFKQEAKERLGCEFYFNAGILLINLKKWREINAEQSCFEIIDQEKSKILWVDQDVLNLLFKNDIKFLHPSWNVQTVIYRGGGFSVYSQQQVDEAIKDPAIIHFIGYIKPWNPNKTHVLDIEYFKYLKYTDWKNFIFKYKLQLLKNFLNGSKFKMTAYKNYDQILNYLTEINFQKQIDGLAQKYIEKKIIVYGAGLVWNVIRDNYDISKLNIIGISDIKFNENCYEQNGFKTFPPQNIALKKPDIVLISLLETEIAEEYFKKELFKKYGKFKFKPFYSNTSW